MRPAGPSCASLASAPPMRSRRSLSKSSPRFALVSRSRGSEKERVRNVLSILWAPLSSFFLLSSLFQDGYIYYLCFFFFSSQASIALSLYIYIFIFATHRIIVRHFIHPLLSLSLSLFSFSERPFFSSHHIS